MLTKAPFIRNSGKLAVLVYIFCAFSFAQVINHSFDGETGTVSSPGTPTNVDHPDMSMAASGTQVVTVDRQAFNVFSYTGTLLQTSTMANFITAAGLTSNAGTPDPRVVYDSYINRFIVVCSCGTDHFIVSGSSDATGTWKGVDLGASVAGDLTMRVGFNSQGVYVSEDNASLTSVYFVISLPTADVAWSGAGNVSLAHENIFSNQNFELFPAIDLNDDGTHTEYFVARNGTQSATNLAMNILLNGLTWSGNTATLSGTSTISTGFLYNTPVDVLQPGTPNIRGTESSRVYQATMAKDGTLHFVVGSGPCASSCGSQGVNTGDIIFWFVVDPVSNKIVQSAKLSSSTLGYIFPSSAMDAAGNEYICATSAGSAQFASIDCWYRLATDAAGIINGPTRVITGTQVYAVCATHSPVGWGTYSDVVYDPLNPNAVWLDQEYGASATACLWQERLAQLQIGPPATNSVPSAPILTAIPGHSSPALFNGFPGQQLTEEDLSLWRF